MNDNDYKIFEIKFYPDKDVYWSRDNPAPYCPKCLNDSKLTQLTNKESQANWYCNVHNDHFESIMNQNPFPKAHEK